MPTNWPSSEQRSDEIAQLESKAVKRDVNTKKSKYVLACQWSTDIPVRPGNGKPRRAGTRGADHSHRRALSGWKV